MKFFRALSTFLTLSLLLPFAAFGAENKVEPPQEVSKRLAAGTAVLVDVREEEEWKETGVVASAYLLAMSDLNGDRKEWKKFLETNKQRELILYCRSGNRSGRAAKMLAEEGYRTANAGGFTALKAAGLPVRKATEPRK